MRILLRMLATASPLLAICPPINVKADDHYVSTNGLNVPPYTTWSNAARDIQSAVDVTSDGDRVIVADGLYSALPETNGITWNGNVKHIQVESQNGAVNCVIDCRNRGRAFTLTSNQNSNDIVKGFTIKRGKSRWVFDGSIAVYYGGGAIFTLGSSPTISQCRFYGNYANLSPSGALADGGAIEVAEGSSPLISSNVFNGNLAGHTGGAIHSVGASPKIYFNTFLSNTNNGCYGGGAIAMTGNSYGEIVGNLIVSNQTYYYSQGGYGGAISLMNAGPTIYNNTIAFNSTIKSNNASGEGGGLRIRGMPYPDVQNNIIYGNISTSGLEDLDFQYTNALSIKNNIVGSGSTNFTFPTPNNNQFGVDPQFVDPSNGDFRLQFSSPAINAGTTTSPMLACDLDGNPRIQNGVVDIGCYEQLLPMYLILAQCGSNGRVSASTSNSVIYGGSQRLDISADEYYEIESLETNGVPISEADGNTNYPVCFDNVRTNQDVRVVFRPRVTQGQTPLSWLDGQYHLGTNSVIGAEDTDGDGLSNDLEYRADTNPTDPTSRLRVVGANSSVLGSRVVSWCGGSNSIQVLMYKDSLTDPEWQVLYTNAPPTQTECSYEDIAAGDRRFYRIKAFRN